MNLPQKAILLNTLVFPGVGHLILNRKLKAFIYAGTSIVALIVIFIKVISLANAIVDKLNANILEGETISFMGILGKSFSESNTQIMNIAFLVYLAIWVIAILDVYLVSKNMSDS